MNSQFDKRPKVFIRRSFDYWQKGGRPANWEELGQLIHPGEDEEFYRIYGVYWKLAREVQDTMTLIGLRPIPYELCATHRRKIVMRAE